MAEFLLPGAIVPVRPHGTARFIREVTTGAWWVRAYLFRVTPAMEYDESETYRGGKLLKKRRGLPHRFMMNRKTGKKWNWSTDKEDPLYRSRAVQRSTSFVIASAADLRAMMGHSHARMRGIMKAKGDLAGEKLFEENEMFPFLPEVYLFPADKFGKRKSSGEMPGSQKGTMDHALPFMDMGYEPIGIPEWTGIGKPDDDVQFEEIIRHAPLVLEAASKEESEQETREGVADGRTDL